MVKTFQEEKIVWNFVFYKDPYPRQLWEAKGLTILLCNRKNSGLEFCSTLPHSMLQFLTYREILKKATYPPDITFLIQYTQLKRIQQQGAGMMREVGRNWWCFITETRPLSRWHQSAERLWSRRWSTRGRVSHREEQSSLGESGM